MTEQHAAPRFRTHRKQDIVALLEPLRHKIRDFERLTTDDELARMAATASRIPLARHAADHIADIGGAIPWLPIYRHSLGYRHITLIQFPQFLNWARCSEAQLQQEHGCRFVAANADRTLYAIESGSIGCVVCFEVLEHLQGDPMHLVSEANRILSIGGEFYLTTPNVLSRQNLFRFVFGDHPFSWSVYTNAYGDRHNREYTPFEIARVFEAGGFRPESIETFTHAAKESRLRQGLGWAFCLLPAMLGRVPLKMRHAFIHARARKVQSVRERHPHFLYDLYGADGVS